MADSIFLNGYTITLIRPVICECDGECQTWSYSVIKTGTPAMSISHWTLNLCNDPEHEVLSTSNTTNIGTAAVDFSDPTCFSIGDKVIKWDIPEPNDNYTTGTFTFTLEGCFEEEQVAVALKAGTVCYEGFITGPSCREITTTSSTSTSTTSTSTTSTSTTSTSSTTSTTSTSSTTTTAPIFRGVRLI